MPTGFVTGMGSLWSLVFITYDRYNVIVHGVSGQPLTFGKAGIMVIFIWVNGIGTSLFPFFGWGNYIPEGVLFYILAEKIQDKRYSFSNFI